MPKVGKVSPERFKSRRKRMKLSQAQLGERVGVTQQAIGDIETGKTVNPGNLSALARELRVPVEILLEGGEDGLENEGLTLFSVPLISWVEAGALADTSDPYLPGDTPEWTAVTHRHGNLIALRVSGASMDKQAPDGSIIVVDLEDRNLVDGKYYVCRLEGRSTFKQYRSNPARLMPQSYDPEYLPVPLEDGIEVVGRVIQVNNRL